MHSGTDINNITDEELKQKEDGYGVQMNNQIIMFNGSTTEKDNQGVNHGRLTDNDVRISPKRGSGPFKMGKPSTASPSGDSLNMKVNKINIQINPNVKEAENSTVQSIPTEQSQRMNKSQMV